MTPMKITRAMPALLILSLSATSVNAQDFANEVSELRQLLMTIQVDYDARISDLEERLARAERQSRSAQRDADEAIELVEQTAIDQSAGSSAPNAFNPAIGVILVGGYADIDSSWDQIPGFQPAGEIGSGESGFSSGEAEINLNASVDARYFGNLTLGIGEVDGSVDVGLEEAWFQTTSLPMGLSVLGGRFFSEAGYLNSFHFHSDDFTDRPLPYQAFFGGRYTVDGVQARWVALLPCWSKSARSLTGVADFLQLQTKTVRREHGHCSAILAAMSETATAGNSGLHGFAQMPWSGLPKAHPRHLPVTAILRS